MGKPIGMPMSIPGPPSSFGAMEPIPVFFDSVPDSVNSSPITIDSSEERTYFPETMLWQLFSVELVYKLSICNAIYMYKAHFSFKCL